MSEVDIDYFTLHRLTERAFKFDNSDKEQYRNKITECFQQEDPVESILNFIEQEYTARKIIFAVSTADPKTALKPKGKMFRRAGEGPDEAVFSQPSEVSETEFLRRQVLAREASQRLVIMSDFQEDDDDDEQLDMNEDEIEESLKKEIMNSRALSGKREDEDDE